MGNVGLHTGNLGPLWAGIEQRLATRPSVGLQKDPIMGKELRDVLSEAQAKGSAVGHFNVGDLAILKAVMGAARDMKTAVIVGVSEGERTYLGTRQIAAAHCVA